MLIFEYDNRAMKYARIKMILINSGFHAIWKFLRLY